MLVSLIFLVKGVLVGLAYLAAPFLWTWSLAKQFYADQVSRGNIRALDDEVFHPAFDAACDKLGPSRLAPPERFCWSLFFWPWYRLELMADLTELFHLISDELSPWKGAGQ